MPSAKKTNAKLVYFLFGRLNNLFGEVVTISRDPLCRMYAVNRYDIIVRHVRDWKQLPSMRGKLIESLVEDGWKFIHPSSPLYRNTMYKCFNGRHVTLIVTPVYGNGPCRAAFQLCPHTCDTDQRQAVIISRS